MITWDCSNILKVCVKKPQILKGVITGPAILPGFLAGSTHMPSINDFVVWGTRFPHVRRMQHIHAVYLRCDTLEIETVAPPLSRICSSHAVKHTPNGNPFGDVFRRESPAVLLPRQVRAGEPRRPLTREATHTPARRCGRSRPSG